MDVSRGLPVPEALFLWQVPPKVLSTSISAPIFGSGVATSYVGIALGRDNA